MTFLHPSARLLALLLPLALHPGGVRAENPALLDVPRPGTMQVRVDATDLDHRILRVHETVPVQPGTLTLLFPLWLPGTHGPVGQVGDIAGLVFSAGGQPMAWRRDPLNVQAFVLEVPSGVGTLDVDFQSLTPLTADSGRVTMTPEMLGVQWNDVLLYPAGYFDSRITVQPTLRLPEGWQFGSALEVATTQGASTTFKPVSVETLIDSPVFAGRYMARVDLDPDASSQGRPPIHLDVMADSPAELAMTPEQLAIHRALVTQADRLYGARHYAHYDMLLAISDRFGGIGLEHHQSSENGVDTGYFAKWSAASTGRDLLSHEYTHSWNGKFRRPADLWTPNTNVPMQDSLLWVYEGQTQFWGDVLAARSGLIPQADMLEVLANTAAWTLQQDGRAWRNLQDTTNEAAMGERRASHGWRDWQRGSDYYEEMVMVWLEADMLIRDESGGKRSLDDFARAFFGVDPGRVKPLLYAFDGVVSALNEVQPHDWARFLRDRLDTHATGGQLRGLERSGWRLAWSETPSGVSKASATRRKVDDFAYSLGIQVGPDGMLKLVRWGSPAFAAGLSNSVQLLAVDGLAYTPERLGSAITAAKDGKAPIQLLVKDGDHFRTASISYAGGLRYPKLERIDGVEDRLSKLLAARP